MKYISLFSGVGGFELAINDKGECIGFSEVDKYAISVYNYHFPKHKLYGDISKIDWNTVPDFDLVVGGSLCQDLSVAGKQQGLSGARSGLFFEFIKCLKEKQPTNFIWENVKGALSSSSGWDFARVQIEFSEAGYDCEWQVLNAKDFGVPQNRERIFVVGHLRGKSRPKVFPIRTTNEQTIKQINQPTHSNDRVYSDDGISPSLNTMQDGRRQPKVVSLRWSRNELGKEARRKSKRETGIDYTPFNGGHRNLIPAKENISGAITGALNKDALLGVETRIRRLTPLECERLMSWPDNWTKTGTIGEISDTQRYKMCGNGVVSKVVEAIIERLYFIDQISQSTKEK